MNKSESDTQLNKQGYEVLHRCESSEETIKQWEKHYYNEK